MTTRDFTKKRDPVYFTANEERFNCYKALDLEQLTRFTGVLTDEKAATAHEGENSRESTDDELDVAEATAAARRIEQVVRLMKIVLKKESYVRFIARVRPSDEDRERDDFEPIDQTQLIDITRWLIEVYTGRPTEPSSSSSAGSGSGDGGTSSTAGALPVESEQPTSIPVTFLT